MQSNMEILLKQHFVLSLLLSFSQSSSHIELRIQPNTIGTKFHVQNFAKIKLQFIFCHALATDLTRMACPLAFIPEILTDICELRFRWSSKSCSSLLAGGLGLDSLLVGQVSQKPNPTRQILHLLSSVLAHRYHS